MSLISWTDELRSPTLGIPMTYLRFGIRDLLWAMIVVGLASGWWLDHRNDAIDVDSVNASLEVFLSLAPSERPTIDELLEAAEELKRSR